MHLEHFMEAVENKQIRFSSIASFRDPYEGEFPYSHDLFLSECICFLNDGGFQNCMHMELIKKLRIDISPTLTVPLRFLLQTWKQYLFAHCWSLGENPRNENPSDQIITIKSTIGQIKNAVSGDYNYHIGEIKYINYLTETFPAIQELKKRAGVDQMSRQGGEVVDADLVYERHLHKWHKYQSEQEVRIMISWKSFSSKHPKVKQIVPSNPYTDKIPEKLYGDYNEDNYLIYKGVDFSKLITIIKAQKNISPNQRTDLESALVRAGVDSNKLLIP